MAQVRKAVRSDVQNIADSTREMSDWRVYVRRYPWVMVGGAAVLGYLIVPRRLNLISPDADALRELAKRNNLVVKSEPHRAARPGIAKTALAIIANAAIRSAVAYAGNALATKSHSGVSAAAPDVNER